MVDGLARALGTLGHRITVYVRREDALLPDRVRIDANVTVAHLDAGPPIVLSAAETVGSIQAFAARLGEEWQRERPHSVHAFAWMSGKAALAAARGAQLPFVQTFHPMASRGRRADDVVDEQAALARGAARILATSSSQVFALLGLGANPAAIKFVPCGVDLGLFTPGPARKRNDTNCLRIVTLGALGAREGIADVIEALPFLTGVELVIGGGRRDCPDICADPEVARLQAIAGALGVADRVTFRGHVRRNDVPAFLRSGEIVVCAPHDDSLGTVAVEAMASGVAVIASAVGGLADAVADGMTGLHVPARAPRQIAYAIESLQADPARRERFGRFGVERATARYSWSRIAGETLEIYRSVAAGGTRFAHHGGSETTGGAEVVAT